MSLVMTATPISMHTLSSFSLEDTTGVIQGHILAMYVPSLFSGWLISRLGAANIIRAGLGLMLVCLFIGYGSPTLVDYWVSLILPGGGLEFPLPWRDYTAHSNLPAQ